MYSKKIFITIFAGLLFCSCARETDNKVGVININPYQVEDYVNLSEIADSIKCIKLQLDANDVMGMVLKIIIKKKYIYAWDISQMEVFVFDKEGHFVSKLDKKGEGPGEYQRFSALLVDDDEENIEIYTHLAMLKYKNISFEYVESRPFPDVYCSMMVKNAGFYYSNTQVSDNSGIVAIDDKNNVSTLFGKKIETDHRYFSVNIGCFTENDKKELFASLLYDNTFYRLENGEAHPVLSVDFGKYGMNNDIGMASTSDQMKYLRDMEGVAFFPLLNIYNENIVSFSYYFKEKIHERAWYNENDYRQYLKIKDKIYHMKCIKNDISNFPDRLYLSSSFYECIHDVLHEDYLVDIVLPDKYFSNISKKKIFVEGIGEISADDDPVIVLMKLKK